MLGAARAQAAARQQCGYTRRDARAQAGRGGAALRRSERQHPAKAARLAVLAHAQHRGGAHAGAVRRADGVGGGGGGVQRARGACAARAAISAAHQRARGGPQGAVHRAAALMRLTQAHTERSERWRCGVASRSGAFGELWPRSGRGSPCRAISLGARGSSLPSHAATRVQGTRGAPAPCGQALRVRLSSRSAVRNRAPQRLRRATGAPEPPAPARAPRARVPARACAGARRRRADAWERCCHQDERGQ